MYECGCLILEQTELSRVLEKFDNAEKNLYCCCWWAAHRVFWGAGVEAEESSAAVVLAWVACLWRVAFVCGPQLVGLQRT